MRNNFQSKSVPRGTRTLWRYLSALILLFSLGIGNVWGANPYYASQDWGSDDFSSVVANHTNVVITSSATAFQSNLSGKYYIQCGSSSGITSGYMRFAATEQIDSVSIFFIGNSTTAAGISWCGWGKNVTPSVEVGSNYGSTATFAYSAKNYDNARWMTIDVSDKNLYTLQIFRQGKNLTNNGNNISNFGANQTINILGIKVWLHPTVTKYTITYAKGEYGTGDAIANGEKTKDVAFTLSSSTYTRENYTQQGWSTTDGGAKVYDLGGTYEDDAAITLYPFWVSSAATQSNITYTNTKGADNSNPAKYYEGTGVTSFEALDDVTGFHFTGWDPASIGTTATGIQTITAQWVAAYNVSFNAGAGSGTVPASFQKWEGAKFNLPGQGSMVAPAGKAFDGWKANGAGDKLAADAEYTMGNAAVEFVAQWKAVPTTIFYWTAATTNAIETDNTDLSSTTYGTLTTGTSVKGRLLGTNTIAKNGSGYKLGNDDVCIEIQGTSSFEEGDTVIITGKNGGDGDRCFTVAPSSASSAASSDTIKTNTISSQTDNSVYKVVITDTQAGSKMRIFRLTGKTMYCKSIKVIRPAERPASTVITLSDLKVNNRSISSDSLATLVSAHSLTLKDEFAAAPEIKFNEHTVITYDDELLPATKVTDKVYTVTATVNGAGKWQAQQTINSVAYTVTAEKLNSAKVYYYDGATKLGEEIVAINGSPVNAGDYDDKTLSSFVGWYNNADLAEEHRIANIAALVVTKDTTVYGNWNPEYATSINIEQWTLTNGAGKGNSQKDVQTGALVSLLGTNNFASNLAYENNNLELDSLDDAPGKTNRNYAFLGLKVKKSGRMLDFRLAAGKTVKIKFGEIKSTLPQVAIDGGSYANMSITDKVYTYTAAADAYISIKTADANAVVFKQIMIGDAPEFETVTLPAIVTLDADGGTYADASLKYTGTPLVIGDATPADADHLFDGWYDGETKIDASAYVPTANVTLVAKYVVKPSPFSLTGLTYTVGAGEPQNVGYVEGTYTYTVELPYAGSYDAITVAATLKEAGSSIVDDATKVLTVTSLPGAATFTVSDGAEGTQLYTINFKKGAKDGVEIIGVVTTGGTNKTVSGLYKGDATVNLDSDKKIGSGKYIYVTLASGYTFEETDVLVVNVEKKSDLDGGTKALEITTGVGNIDGEVWKSIALEDYTTGENTIPLTGIAEEQTSIGLKRSANQNAWINGLKVYRPMMPELTAISFNGVAATKGTGNAFSVTLPEAGTNLASLTIVPTIIRNAAHATTPQAVVSNEGAWKEGANTYRVMDKDGDYTDYTITITLQGQAPAPVITTQPADVAYCAGSEPTLTVEATGNELHYAWFKEAGETDEAVGTDAASYTIASAGTYYVVVTNHVDGKLDASVTSENAVVTLNAPVSITTQPTDLKKQTEGANITLSVVAANATGYQWYRCDNKEKENATAITGADEKDYTFPAAPGFFYCEVTGLCGAIESNVAEVTIKRSAGCQYINATSGSQANLADGTIMYACGSDGKLSTGDNFAEASSNAKAIDADAVGSINKQYCVVKFPADVEEITLFGYNGSSRSVNNLCYGTAVGTDVKVNTAISSDDYVKTASNDGNERSMTIEFDEPFAKEKYLFIKYNSALEIYRICYTAALVEPKLPTLVNQELCAGAAYEAFDATITNAAACEGTVSYAWYSTANTETPVATTATFTPSAEGTYYVVVTHAAAGHVTRTVQSANLSVAHFDALAMVSHSDDVFQHKGTAATLSVVATGKNVAYVWYTCSNAAGDDAVAITPAQTEASLAIASVAEGVKYYKVVISHDCDATTLSHIFKVEGWDQLEQVDVTASTVWDMTNVSEDAINLKNLNPSKQNVRLLLANIEGVNNNASFNSQALMFEGQHIGRTSNNVKHLAGRYVQFNVTVPGMVSVTFASNDDNKERTIAVNGKKCTRDTTNATYLTYDVAVEPGSVEIIGYEGENANQYVRISKIEFKATADYTRPVNPAYLGTLCWTNNAILGGATLYEFAGKNENNYLVFDEVEENRLEAGKPYIFMPENGNTEIKLYNTDDAAPLMENQPAVKHMYGTVVAKDLYPTTDVNMYYFSSNHIWAVKDFTSVEKITVPAYYCYVDYEGVLNDNPAPAPAPGRRRVTMGVNGKNTPTDIDAINASEQPMKLLINGQIFILRGEKMFDATGRLVK